MHEGDNTSFSIVPACRDTLRSYHGESSRRGVPKTSSASGKHMATAAINVQNLTKNFGPVLAVDDVSFQVQPGELVGFLGPNGAGKTTTMRMLTCFFPPTEGKATVAGFDVFEQPLEVKRRIGYLPETPPLYLEMETIEYLRFVGRLKGLSGTQLETRVAFVLERCNIGDVKTKLLSKLSKGYRQRVGLAQAIIHNPDVLILDEPTAGLDPKQINETRDLIKSLAGDHTIILSTHILPEVEQTCESVLIINKGKLVATDSVHNLQARARGAETILVNVGVRSGEFPLASVRERLAAIPGVSSSTLREEFTSGATFELESKKGELVRGDLARTIVQAGWDLNELRPAAMSLEEIFLQLTGTEAAATKDAAAEPPADAAGSETPAPEADA
jgi:ABC-2 type transport system ATP-binding protein